MHKPKLSPSQLLQQEAMETRALRLLMGFSLLLIILGLTYLLRIL